MQRIIAQVIDYGGTTGGSFIAALCELSRATLARSERFVVIANMVAGAEWPDQLRDAGAEVHIVSKVRDVCRLLQQIRPGIVHSHFRRFDLAVLAAPRHSRLFWHVHSFRHRRTLAARLKSFILYRAAAARVEAFVPVSNALAAECIQFGAPANRVKAVPNGIDTAIFRPPNGLERAGARARFGVAGEGPVVLFFERTPYKGGATVNEAMRALPAFRLLVAGGTVTQREAFGSPPRVATVERVSTVRELYWAADILAFASHNEAFGFVLAEALACGLRVAATDIPVAREIAADLDCVEFVPVSDVPALIRAIEKLSSLQSRSGAGRTRIVERFDLMRWTADIQALYG